MKIRFFRHTDIDKEKYDRCILNAQNGVIYSMSWYLDTVAPNWQLLATDDYSFVMPIPKKEKFGLSYVLQPLMCQQLGIFSPEKISEKIYYPFIKKIPAIYCILQLNSGNMFGQKELHPNYILDIRQDYPRVRNLYHGNTRTNLKKTAKIDLIIDNQTAFAPVLKLAQQQPPHYASKALALDTAQKLSAQAHEKGHLFVRCVREESTMELLAGVSFFRWKNRFYYLITVSSAKGKATGAMRLLIDRFIAEFAGQDYWIDFEGSAIPSVAQFYRNFGAIAEWYPVFRNSAARIFKYP
ncbi:MAG: hypothetical protein LBH19_01010 [Dysgonamonadaceae bacterium]|jgi:hypothetical protein|nr:hypothetical protein [Dysgonamonadaceae bacterium]